jgi:5'-nucleotidase
VLKLNILLTNDDGIESEKLHYTKKVLQEYGTVYVVAPKFEQSAKSMALTIGGFDYEKLEDKTYAVSGTPVDCVNFAYGSLEIDFDLVVSGTNNGYNLGIDTRYSGTVGAALQAQYFGYNTIALSSDRNGSVILNKELKKTLDYIFENKLLSQEYTLNVNFPRDKFIESNGIMMTELYYHKFEYKPKVTDTFYHPNRQYIHRGILPEGTDTYAYAKGYTSITKIKV